jgi:hypothetical protein
MTAIDLKRELKALYNPPSKDVVFVDVPAMPFLMIDGTGDPNTSTGYREAIEALYGVAYALKFMLKRGPQAADYVVMPSEGLWWSEDMADFLTDNRAGWQWTMMIAQPPPVTGDMVAAAIEETRKKKGLPGLAHLRSEVFQEGLSAQIMHHGPYAAEGPTIARLHEQIAAGGYRRRGKHHEIYLSDPRRSDPEKMRTVLRQPVIF